MRQEVIADEETRKDPILNCSLHRRKKQNRIRISLTATQHSWNCFIFSDTSKQFHILTQDSYKEGLSRTVVRELLPRATAHGHQTFPDYGRHTRSRSKGGDVREEAPDEECAAKNLQTTVRHLGFTEKI